MTAVRRPGGRAQSGDELAVLWSKSHLLISYEDTITFDVSTDAVCAGSAAFNPKLMSFMKNVYSF